MDQKIGRNDPCHCGSGKKYKNCHMAQDNEKTAAKYTPSGKRKFKAKVIKMEDPSLSVFTRSATAPQIPTDVKPIERNKFRMTRKDFRAKEGAEEGQEETLPFELPSSETPAERPSESKEPKLDAPFQPAKEDFRKQKGEDKK